MARKPWADKGSASERGYGYAWQKLRKQALKRDNYLCQECLMQGKLTPLCVKPYDHAVDHRLPKSQGGTDDLSNVRSLCSACHLAVEEKQFGRKRIRQVGLDGYPL